MATDSLQCDYEDARRNHLRDGIALSTVAKIAFFEEMVALAAKFGARDRLAAPVARKPDGAPATSPKSSTAIPSSSPRSTP